MSENDPDQLAQLWKWATGAIGLGAAWLWNNTMGRIKALEDGKVSNVDFQAHVERSDRSREELRKATISLFEGQGKIAESLARIEGSLQTGHRYDQRR
ncbi:hypothetical protein UFOVP1670_34 [uncultured Caudovirales phage]|uniref:Uncharacterized protein n=1 Tax=uncultured Caudovirales phage TaxID=2100421 RepID=A0A6J5T8A7_9CAUD|nr:hypothetical protein UFOVP1670_34 [uncultured Caudovirales phage]